MRKNAEPSNKKLCGKRINSKKAENSQKILIST
jgi:hypothetical protein